MSDSIQLTTCDYGKTGIRLLKVERDGARHELKDVNVSIQVFGLFERSFLEGDNCSVLPTDTMKNIVYVLARQGRLGEIEEFGTRIASHLLARHSQLTEIRISISESIWERIVSNGQPQDSSFRMATRETRTAVVEMSRTKTSIQAGIKNLSILKTSHSAFAGFLRDEYTTLRDTKDRLFATTMNAEWSYDDSAHDFKQLWSAARAALLNTFASHVSQSVQHTLYAMGSAVLIQVPAIDKIRVSMPNRHCFLLDLSAFRLENPNEVFVPVEEPAGLIEATLERLRTVDELESSCQENGRPLSRVL